MPVLTIDDLRAIVSEALGDATTVPSDDDDLIAAGLDSLAIMRIGNRLRRAGAQVGFAELAREPTLAAWAGALAEVDSQASDPPARERVERVDEREPFAFAPMQHAYWIGRAGEEALGGVGAHLYVELDGHGVDPERLRRALGQLVARHPMLRVRVLDDGRQQILPCERPPELPVSDLRDAAPADVAARTSALRDELSHQQLDLAGGQVFDLRLTLLPGGRTRVHLDVDFLAVDARSYRTLLADLRHCYEQPDEPQPPLRFGYAQYLAERAREPSRPADVAYWRKRLAELPGAPELPARPEHDRGDATRITRLHRWLAPEVRAQLTEQAQRHGVTPAAALATAFAEVVGAWSAEPRFLLNVPLFDRRPLHPDVDAIVGDFTSSVMLDVDVREPLALAERARRLQARLHDGVAHGSYPGLDVLRDLTRAAGAQVLAPVVFTSALSVGELFGPEVERCFGEPVWIVSQSPQVVLDAQISELHGGLLANWDVRAGALADGVGEAMFAAFGALLERMTTSAGWSAPAGPLVPAAQRHVHAAANETSGPLPERPLHAAFFARAAREPAAPAVLGGERPLSYGELADLALRVAACLRDRGVTPGDAVAVRLARGPEQVVAVLGVLACGAHYVPLDPSQPPVRAARMLARAGAEHVLDATAYERAAGHPRPLAGPLDVAVAATAYVIFTSGSTGEPKGVEITHAQAANTVEDLVDRFAIGPADRTLLLSALDFDLSVFDIFAPLAVGGAVVVVDDERQRDPAAWLELVREHGVTVVDCVPQLVDLLLQEAERSVLAPSLRLVLTGGDWVGTDLAGRLWAHLPDCRLVALGGATEASIYSNHYEVRDTACEAWTSIPYGTPLRNQRLRIVDAQGRDCPDWVAGELWIGGAGVATGYRGDPDRTAERFVAHGGLRWYRTGDRARWRDDGVVEFLGRADDQVKLRGFRIELGEVEAALVEQAAVRHAVALVDRSGAAPQLCAAAVCERGVDAAAIAAFASQRLPAQMVPERLLVVDELPLTPNGKVDRRAIASLLAAGREQARRVAPRTPLEAAIAHMWTEELDPARPVGVEDDYFLLGGDSVSATVLVGRLREALATEAVSVRDVLTARTVAGLARRIAAREETPQRLTETAELYLEIAALSDDEVQAQLRAEPAGLAR